MLIGGGNYCLAQETAYKTLSFPDENKANNKVGSYEKTWTAKIGDFSWEIVNFNNNYWNWSNIRAGRSKAASVAKIKNETPFDRAIGKVVVDIAEIANAKIKILIRLNLKYLLMVFKLLIRQILLHQTLIM